MEFYLDKATIASALDEDYSTMLTIIASIYADREYGRGYSDIEEDYLQTFKEMVKEPTGDLLLDIQNIFARVDDFFEEGTESENNNPFSNIINSNYYYEDDETYYEDDEYEDDEDYSDDDEDCDDDWDEDLSVQELIESNRRKNEIALGIR